MPYLNPLGWVVAALTAIAVLAGAVLWMQSREIAALTAERDKLQQSMLVERLVVAQLELDKELLRQSLVDLSISVQRLHERAVEIEQDAARRVDEVLDRSAPEVDDSSAQEMQRWWNDNVQ